MKINSKEIIDKAGNIVHYFQNSIASKEDKNNVKLIACGDTGVVRKLEDIVLSKGPSHVLSDISIVLDSVDIKFINMEALFSEKGYPLDREPVFRASPNAFAIIKEINPTVACLANNHMFDYGYAAFEETTLLLNKNNIVYFGAAATYENAIKPALIEVKGIKIGFIGFREKEAKDFDHNGVITPEIDKKVIAAKINELKKSVDIIVLSLHFGWEYQFYPSPKDISLCHFFIDMGANLILGHHPHYPQGVEIYKQGLICYSLGNFIWDQNFIGHTNSSYMLEITLNKKEIETARIIPFTMTKDYKIVISKKPESFQEINNLSTGLTVPGVVNERWYFISKNKVFNYLRTLYTIVLKKENKWVKLSEMIRRSNTPRLRYTFLSFLFFICSFQFLFYEISNRYKRNSK